MNISHRDVFPKRLLNPASGYLKGYSHTLNPYAGCAYACSYCYVREMPIAKFRAEAWGTWVDSKRSAALLLEKELTREKSKGPVTIFMSSSTDPYQPAEHDAKLTRSLLEVMTTTNNLDFVLIQTRSPLITRDIDVLVQLGKRVRVSLTVETDMEPIRKAFAPSSPPIPARMKALRQLVDAGIPAQAAISPVLPYSDRFAKTLAETGLNRLCIDDFFMGDGSMGRRTERMGIRRIYEVLGLESWYDPSTYLKLVNELRSYFPPEQIWISQSGFLP